MKTQLKTSGARQLLSEVNKKAPVLPFSLRGLELDEKSVKLGISECAKMGSLSSFPVLEEKDGCCTAHFRFTVLLLPGGSLKITGGDLPPFLVTEKVLPTALAAVRDAVAYVKPVKGSGGGAVVGEAMKE